MGSGLHEVKIHDPLVPGGTGQGRIVRCSGRDDLAPAGTADLPCQGGVGPNGGLDHDTSKEQPERFDASKPQHRWKLWTRIFSSQAGGEIVVIFWKRVWILLAALAVLGWFGGTAGVWALVKYRRGFTTARYVDLALAWRMHYYRGEIAQGYEVSAQDRMKVGDANGAIGYLSAALAMVPDSLQLRHELAVAQSRAGLGMGSFLTLKDGAKQALAAADVGYLRDTFTVAFDLQDDDAAAQLGQSLLPAKPIDRLADLFVAFQTATAWYNRGHFEEAAQLIKAWKVDARPEGLVMVARCWWGEGKRAEAQQLLAGAVDKANPKDEIYKALAEFAKAQGDHQEERRFALLRWLATPDSAAAEADYLYTLHVTGQEAEVTRETEVYLQKWGKDLGALAMLDWFAVRSGRPDIAQVVGTLVVKAGGPRALADVRTAQADVSGKQDGAALKACDGLQQQVAAIESGGGRSPLLVAMVAGVKAAAMAGQKSDAAGAAFNLFLGEAGDLPVSDLLWFADQFGTVGAKESQRRLLEAGRKGRPDNQEILSAEVRADAEAGDRAAVLEHLPALLRTRIPAPEALDAALKVLNRPEDAEVAAQVREAAQRSRELFP